MCLLCQALCHTEFPQEKIIMDKLAEIDSMDNRLEAALEMFCFIARSQIFLDGNKRVAQLMCNKIMMETSYEKSTIN